MPPVEIARMFDVHRIQNEQDVYKVFLYLPIGCILFLFRLTVLILTWPFLAFLPQDSTIRSILLKGLSLIFGIFVNKDVYHRNHEAKFIVCNHISILDHIAVESVLSCKQVDFCSHFCSEWNFHDYFGDRNLDNDVELLRSKMTLLQHSLNVSDVPTLIFPECTTTNGKYGLLKFHTCPFDITSLVQPVVIELVKTSFINISPCVLGSNCWRDFFWLLFIPYTVFIVRVLPSMSKIDTESVENFVKRLQNAMAASLNLVSTEYTSKNKTQFERNTIFMPGTTPRGSTQEYHSPEIIMMANQVKEVLPNVPLSVIQQDLERTRNVDDTVSRIVEGIIDFVPENHSNAASSSGGTQFNEDLPTLNTAAEEFGRTPDARMLSYQERKATLIRAARLRYLRKHNLL